MGLLSYVLCIIFYSCIFLPMEGALNGGGKGGKGSKGGGGTEVVPVRHGLLIALDSLFFAFKSSGRS